MSEISDISDICRRVYVIYWKHVIFLFGARGTGKSHLLREWFGSRALLWLDLLRDRDYVTYQKNPELLYDQALSLISDKTAFPQWIIIRVMGTGGVLSSSSF